MKKIIKWIIKPLAIIPILLITIIIFIIEQFRTDDIVK